MTSEPRDRPDRSPEETFHVPWSPFAAAWVFLLQMAAVVLVGAALQQFMSEVALSEGLARVLLLPVTSIATAILTVVVVAGRHPGHTWRLLGPRSPRWQHVARGIGYGLLAYLAVPVVLGWMLRYAVTLGGGEMPVVQQSFRAFAADPVAAPVFFVAVVLAAPIGEELLYRGMLFQAVRSRVGVWPGIGVSGLTFGAVHLTPAASVGANLLVLVTVSALGMILAWIFQRTGSLVVVITAHCLFNAISAVLLITGIGSA